MLIFKKILYQKVVTRVCVQSINMCDQSNIDEPVRNTEDSDNFNNIDTAGIFKDSSNPNHCLRRIASHLHKINDTLESLDSELVKYRACVRNKIAQKVDDTTENDESDERLWWYREIKNEMKISHYYASYCLRILCRDFCGEEEHDRYE